MKCRNAKTGYEVEATPVPSPDGKPVMYNMDGGPGCAPFSVTAEEFVRDWTQEMPADMKAEAEARHRREQAARQIGSVLAFLASVDAAGPPHTGCAACKPKKTLTEQVALAIGSRAGTFVYAIVVNWKWLLMGMALAALALWVGHQFPASEA